MKTFKASWDEVMNTPYHIVEILNFIEQTFNKKTKDDMEQKMNEHKF